MCFGLTVHLVERIISLMLMLFLSSSTQLFWAMQSQSLNICINAIHREERLVWFTLHTHLYFSKTELGCKGRWRMTQAFLTGFQIRKIR